MAKKDTNTLKVSANELVRDKAGMATIFDSVQAEGKKVDRLIQVALCSAILHAQTHGDWPVCNTVISKLSAGLRTNAARAMVETFAPVRWNKKTKEFVFAEGKRIENFEQSEQFKTMLSTDWLSFKPEPEFRPVDTVSSLESLVKRLRSGLDDERNLVSEREIGLIESVLAQVNALRVPAVLDALAEVAAPAQAEPAPEAAQA